jgi:hypothetical protein
LRYLRVGGRGQNSESRILFGCRKSPKMAQNPQRQVHALLAGVLGNGKREERAAF